MKRLLVLLCVVVVMGALLVGAVGTISAQDGPPDECECECLPGGAPCRKSACEYGASWQNCHCVDYGAGDCKCQCQCLCNPAPTPVSVPTPEPIPAPTPETVTIYVTAGPNEWIELTSEDGLDVWWVGQCDKEGGLILSTSLVPGLLHRFYNPAHKIVSIRDLTTNQTPVDLHPDHGCKNCVRK